MVSITLNIGSIVLGLGAWVFACMAIVGKKRNLSHGFTVTSFSMCVLSLILQLFEINNRVNIGDYAAIEDTIRAVIMAAVVLSVITFVLNVIALFKNKKGFLTSLDEERE